MTARITPDHGAWPALLEPSCPSRGDIDRAAGTGAASAGGLAPASAGGEAGGRGNGDRIGGTGQGQAACIAPRFVAAAQAKATLASSRRGAGSRRSTADTELRLQAAKAREPDAGAALGLTSGRATAAAARGRPSAEAAHVHASNADAMQAASMNGPAANAMVKDEAARKKLVARIHLRAPRPRPSGARVMATPGDMAAGTDTASGGDAASRTAMPPLTASCAIEVAEHIRGQRRGKAAGAYLARFAQQQEKRGLAALTQLVHLLRRSDLHTDTSWAPHAPLQPAPHASVQIRDAARQATEAWLLSGYLLHDRMGVPPGTEPALIDGLQGNVERVLGRLEPRDLLALHARLTVDDAGAVSRASRMFSRQMDAAVNAVGFLAVRDAWAASAICDQVGQPLGFSPLCRILQNAAAISGSKADTTSIMQVIKNLAPLAIERFQHLLLQFLRIRTEEILRQQGIPINELVGIARIGLSESDHAAAIAEAFRAAFPSAIAARHMPDEKIRRRLNTLLSQFSDRELRCAAAGLSIGEADFAQRARSLQRRVESHGVDDADRAALGRRLMILCAVIARELAERFPDEATPFSLDGLREWQWDERFSLDWHISPPPSRLRRVAGAMSRGFRRMLFAVFDSYREDERRVRDAYAAVVQSAQAFVGSAAANPPAGTEAGARLVRAIHRCQAVCTTPGRDIARRRLQIPADTTRLLDAALRDALGRTSGAHVDTLGRLIAGGGDLPASAGEVRGAERVEAPHLIARLYARLKQSWQPSLGRGDAQLLISRLRVTVNEEAGIRAAAEIFRALDRHLAAAQTDAGPTMATQTDAGPTTAAQIEARPTTAAEIEAWPTMAANEDASPSARLLTDIRALEQRFRPLDDDCFPQAIRSRLDWPGLLDLGLKRLPPAQRDRLWNAICDLDTPRPVWLTQDELWLSVVRCFQARGRLV